MRPIFSVPYCNIAYYLYCGNAVCHVQKGNIVYRSPCKKTNSEWVLKESIWYNLKFPNRSNQLFAQPYIVPKLKSCVYIIMLSQFCSPTELVAAVLWGKKSELLGTNQIHHLENCNSVGRFQIR